MGDWYEMGVFLVFLESEREGMERGGAGDVGKKGDAKSLLFFGGWQIILMVWLGFYLRLR